MQNSIAKLSGCVVQIVTIYITGNLSLAACTIQMIWIVGNQRLLHLVAYTEGSMQRLGSQEKKRLSFGLYNDINERKRIGLNLILENLHTP